MVHLHLFLINGNFSCHLGVFDFDTSENRFKIKMAFHFAGISLTKENREMLMNIVSNKLLALEHKTSMLL